MSYSSNLPAVKVALDRAVEQGLREVAIFLERDVKATLSRANTPRRRMPPPGDQPMVGLNPSEPGTAPKSVSNRLRTSIGHEVVRAGARVVAKVGVRRGPTERYAAALELGSPGGKIIVPIPPKKKLRFLGRDGEPVFVDGVVSGRIAPRPFLRRSLLRNRDRIRAVFAAGSRKGIVPVGSAFRLAARAAAEEFLA